MAQRLFAVASTLALGGCAVIDADTCRTAEWQMMGFRDALYGMQPQDEVYRHRCEQHGIKIDAARYAQGWQEGKYEFDRRTSVGVGGS